MTIKQLKKCGFIYKRISKNWYLVRIYADKKRFLYHVVIPMRLKK